MEWFFEEYVRGTGVPHYKVEFTAHRSEKGYQVRGMLLQTGVPRFIYRACAVIRRFVCWTQRIPGNGCCSR